MENNPNVRARINAVDIYGNNTAYRLIFPDGSESPNIPTSYPGDWYPELERRHITNYIKDKRTVRQSIMKASRSRTPKISVNPIMKASRSRTPKNYVNPIMKASESPTPKNSVKPILSSDLYHVNPEIREYARKTSGKKSPSAFQIAYYSKSAQGSKRTRPGDTTIFRQPEKSPVREGKIRIASRLKSPKHSSDYQEY